MPDNLKPEDRRKAMRAVKGKGTSPERSLHSMLAGMGLKGWRCNAQDIPGVPDVVFDNHRIAIFVDGCFWHGCPFCGKKLPETNRSYWERKITRNKELATIHERELRNRGWIVLRVWEHCIRNPQERMITRIELAGILKIGEANGI